MKTTLVLTLATLGAFPPVHGALLFYENFESYTAGGADIDGQGGWSSTGAQIQSGTYGGWNGSSPAVTTSGGNFYVGDPDNANSASSLGLPSTVTDTFSAGNTTWFSFVAYQGGNGSNARWGVTLGDDVPDPTLSPEDNSFGPELNGQGLGAGQLLQGSGAELHYWIPNASGDDRTTSSFFGGGRPVFTTLMIDWEDNGTNDTITMFRWDQNKTNTPTLTDWNNATKFTVGVDLDNTSFDTLGLMGNGIGYIDEVRIATDFDSAVTGTVVIPEPSGALLGALGLLALLRRRRI